MAEDTRWSISQTPPDELKKGVLSQIQRNYGPAQWAQDMSIADDTEANTLILRERFSLTKYAEHTDGGDWILRHRPTMAAFFTMPETPQRTAPYAIQFPIKIHFLHEVELPPGVNVAADDVVHDVRNPFFSIRQVQRRKSGTVSTEYEFETLSQAVPAEQMNRFLTDLRTVQND